MKKILLTGGNGFIGKNILESYLVQKYDITAPGSFDLDLTDTRQTDIFFKNRNFDIILHCATKPGHRNAKDPVNLFYSNMRMFENLERHKEKFGKLINFGSGAIYDVSTNISDAKEKDIFKNMGKDEHGFCKYVQHKQIEKLDNVIDLNIFGIFGKYEDWQIRFISNAICKTLFNLPITLRQNRKFSYLWIDDLMPVLEFFIENNVKHKSYNITPDYTVELSFLAEMIKNVSGKNIEIKISQPGSGLEYTGNNSRLKEEFPSVKFTGINEAVSKLYGYYKSNIANINKELLLKDK